MTQRLALLALVACTGCEAVAGIGDVSLASDSSITDGADVLDAPSETGPDGASDTSAETSEDAGDRCPSTRGPKMVAIPLADGKSFCIDATEVTNEQFAEYAKVPPTIELPARCAGVVRQYPAPTGPTGTPQFNVSWCDAYAFCAWAGKRLCRALDTAKPIGSDNSEWTFACTQGGKTAFPYGDTYSATACTVGLTGVDDLPTPVGAATSCHGATEPFASIFDMSGNLSEWVDECEEGMPPRCRSLGGYFGDTDTQALRCASINSGTGMTVAHPVATTLRGLGFRCCRD